LKSKGQRSRSFGTKM